MTIDENNVPLIQVSHLTGFTVLNVIFIAHCHYLINSNLTLTRIANKVFNDFLPYGKIRASPSAWMSSDPG